jgi:hypothetical protein
LCPETDRLILGASGGKLNTIGTGVQLDTVGIIDQSTALDFLESGE